MVKGTKKFSCSAGFTFFFRLSFLVAGVLQQTLSSDWGFNNLETFPIITASSVDSYQTWLFLIWWPSTTCFPRRSLFWPFSERGYRLIVAMGTKTWTPSVNQDILWCRLKRSFRRRWTDRKMKILLLIRRMCPSAKTHSVRWKSAFLLGFDDPLCSYSRRDWQLGWRRLVVKVQHLRRSAQAAAAVAAEAPGCGPRSGDQLSRRQAESLERRLPYSERSRPRSWRPARLPNAKGAHLRVLAPRGPRHYRVNMFRKSATLPVWFWECWYCRCCRCTCCCCAWGTCWVCGCCWMYPTVLCCGTLVCKNVDVVPLCTSPWFICGQKKQNKNENMDLFLEEQRTFSLQYQNLPLISSDLASTHVDIIFLVTYIKLQIYKKYI